MKRATITVLLIGLVYCGLQAQFKLSGEFRPRTEYSHGYKTLSAADQAASLFTSQRTRLNVRYKTDRLTTKLVLQDVRNWGSQRQLVGNEDLATSVHEAWAEANLGSGLSLKMGRQEVIYDNHRIFGNVGWAQQGRSHDLFLAKYTGAISVHLGLAYNQSGQRTSNFYFGPDAYKTLQFLWLNKSINKLSVSILLLNNGVPYASQVDQSGNMIEQGIYYSQTMGSYLNYKLGKLALSGNVYYQMGTDAAGNGLQAYEALVEAQYTISDKTNIGLSYEVLSGNESGSDEVNRSFTPFYGTNHKFNGHMDYFYVGNHMGSIGLQDITIKASQKVKDITLNAHVHAFMSAAEVDENPFLGTELDLFAVYPILKQVKIQLGYSQMFASQGMTAIKAGQVDGMHNWGYVMFSFTPE